MDICFPPAYRGCTLFINFESEQECRKIGTIKCDPNTVSTFELFLTLKQGSRNSWHSMLPQFLKWVVLSFLFAKMRFTCDHLFTSATFLSYLLKQKFYQRWHHHDQPRFHSRKEKIIQVLPGGVRWRKDGIPDFSKLYIYPP